MSRFKKVVFLSLVIFLAIASAGCGLVRINPEKDRQRVVAIVNGEKILKGEFLDYYNGQKVYYGITEEIEKDPKYKETIIELKKNLLDRMITEKIIEEKANEAGFYVTDELREEVKSSILEDISNIAEGKNAQGTTDKDSSAESREFFEKFLEAVGMSEEEYIEEKAKEECVSRFWKDILKGVEASEEDIKRYYDEQLQKQKENPDSAEDAIIQLYRPAGWLRVKYIMISLSDEQKKEYQDLINEGKEEEAERYLAEKLDSIKPKAQEVLDKARSGESFEKLIEMYGPAEGLNVDDGYIVTRERGFFEEFRNEAFKLKEGEISDLIASPDGYYIIKLYEKLPEKVFTLDEKKEEIKNLLDSQKKMEKMNSLIEEWREKADIKKYESRL